MLYNIVYYLIYIVGILVFLLVDYYYVILGCDEVFLKLLLWCKLNILFVILLWFWLI